MPPTAAASLAYSSSGSMTWISIPRYRLRRSSSFTKYDLPAPDRPRITLLWLSSANRSWWTSPWLPTLKP